MRILGGVDKDVSTEEQHGTSSTVPVARIRTFSGLSKTQCRPPEWAKRMQSHHGERVLTSRTHRLVRIDRIESTPLLVRTETG